MKTTETYEIGIRELRRYFPANDSYDISDEFYFSIVDYDKALKELSHPGRFNGYSIVYCVNGSFDVEINLRRYTMNPGSFMLYTPGTIISFSIPEGVDRSSIRFVIIAASSSLVSDLKFDFVKLNEDNVSILDSCIIQVSEDHKAVGRQYVSLIDSLVKSGIYDLKDILKPVFASIFSFVANVMYMNTPKDVRLAEQNSRSKRIFANFMKLVTEDHMEHRYLEYYADQLSLSPKYLSATVKAVSGKSAPEWIDSYIITEAKNLLRYSNLDVKEIGFKMNFNAPSVFCRFFKAQTGMTPTEYRNS